MYQKIKIIVEPYVTRHVTSFSGWKKKLYEKLFFSVPFSFNFFSGNFGFKKTIKFLIILEKPSENLCLQTSNCSKFFFRKNSKFEDFNGNSIKVYDSQIFHLCEIYKLFDQLQQICLFRKKFNGKVRKNQRQKVFFISLCCSNY